MYEDEDNRFFDELYQQWSKTTGAKDTYWMPEEDSVSYAGGEGTFCIWAVNMATEERKFIASVDRDEDAEFIAGLHGAVPDLIRRLHEAVEEAVRADEANDMAQGQLAEALLENIGLRAVIHELETLNDVNL